MSVKSKIIFYVFMKLILLSALMTGRTSLTGHGSLLFGLIDFRGNWGKMNNFVQLHWFGVVLSFNKNKTPENKNVAILMSRLYTYSITILRKKKSFRDHNKWASMATLFRIYINNYESFDLLKRKRMFKSVIPQHLRYVENHHAKNSIFNACIFGIRFNHYMLYLFVKVSVNIVSFLF